MLKISPVTMVTSYCSIRDMVLLRVNSCVDIVLIFYRFSGFRLGPQHILVKMTIVLVFVYYGYKSLMSTVSPSGLGLCLGLRPFGLCWCGF